MPFNYDRDSGEFILTLSDFSGMLNSRDIDSVTKYLKWERNYGKQ